MHTGLSLGIVILAVAAIVVLVVVVVFIHSIVSFFIPHFFFCSKHKTNKPVHININKATGILYLYTCLHHSNDKNMLYTKKSKHMHTGSRHTSIDVAIVGLRLHAVSIHWTEISNATYIVMAAQA